MKKEQRGFSALRGGPSQPYERQVSARGPTFLRSHGSSTPPLIGQHPIRRQQATALPLGDPVSARHDWGGRRRYRFGDRSLRLTGLVCPGVSGAGLFTDERGGIRRVVDEVRDVWSGFASQSVGRAWWCPRLHGVCSCEEPGAWSCQHQSGSIQRLG